MLILSIDQAIANTGVCVYNSSIEKIVHTQVIKTKPPDLLEHRIIFIINELDALIFQYKPDLIVLEKVFTAGPSCFFKNLISLYSCLAVHFCQKNIKYTTLEATTRKNGWRGILGISSSSKNKKEVRDFLIEIGLEYNNQHVRDAICISLAQTKLLNENN